MRSSSSDAEYRAAIGEASDLRANRNKLSSRSAH